MKTRYKLNGRDVSQEEWDAATVPGRLESMLASCRPPAIMTDAVFLEGHCNGSQFAGSEAIGDFYRHEAEAAGMDITGKVYLSGLASYPGDPRAWVAGRGDAQKVLEERGWGAEGSVNVKVDKDKVAPVTGGGLADDLVAEEATHLAQEAGISLEEAAHTVYEARRPHWAPKGLDESVVHRLTTGAGDGDGATGE